jgi:toxin ParE1/3/4
MTRLTFAPAAEIDFAEIQARIAAVVGPNALRGIEERFFEFFDHLAAFPESCQGRPRLGKNIRLGVVSPYSLLYRYDREAGHVLIIRILHGRRKLTRRLLREG